MLTYIYIALLWSKVSDDSLVHILYVFNYNEYVVTTTSWKIYFTQSHDDGVENQ